jgi:hypothetical protein
MDGTEDHFEVTSECLRRFQTTTSTDSEIFPQDTFTDRTLPKVYKTYVTTVPLYHALYTTEMYR